MGRGVKRDMPKVADAELAVLRVLWQKQPLSAREVTEILYADTTNSEIGTVQNLLKRLEGKGLLHRDRSRHTHSFTTTISRAEFAGRQLEHCGSRSFRGGLVSRRRRPSSRWTWTTIVSTIRRRPRRFVSAWRRPRPRRSCSKCQTSRGLM